MRKRRVANKNLTSRSQASKFLSTLKKHQGEAMISIAFDSSGIEPGFPSQRFDRNSVTGRRESQVRKVPGFVTFREGTRLGYPMLPCKPTNCQSNPAQTKVQQTPSLRVKPGDIKMPRLCRDSGLLGQCDERADWKNVCDWICRGNIFW